MNGSSYEKKGNIYIAIIVFLLVAIFATTMTSGSDEKKTSEIKNVKSDKNSTRSNKADFFNIIEVADTENYTDSVNSEYFNKFYENEIHYSNIVENSNDKNSNIKSSILDIFPVNYAIDNSVLGKETTAKANDNEKSVDDRENKQVENDENSLETSNATKTYVGLETVSEQTPSGMMLDSDKKVNLLSTTKSEEANASLGDAALLIYNQIENKAYKRVQYEDINSVADPEMVDAIELLGAYGYYPIDGNKACPDKDITRAELAYMLSPFFGPGIEPVNYEDVPIDSENYSYIAKATEYGWIDGFSDKTFRPDDKMTIKEVVNTINKAIGFSGDDEIDEYVEKTLSDITDDSMDQDEKLRACYNWTRDSFNYLKRSYYEIGDRGWNQQEAKIMFETGLGNCYCYTSVFYYLARRLGYNARSISGVVGHKRSPHGWVEIEEKGITYIYDTELEMAYLRKGQTYDFYHMAYANVPWPYVKSK